MTEKQDAPAPADPQAIKLGEIAKQLDGLATVVFHTGKIRIAGNIAKAASLCRKAADGL